MESYARDSIASRFSLVVEQVTAQELFQDMMATRISPVLRAAGFKRKGRSFEKRRNGYFGFIGFQKSLSNTKNEVSFTVNVGAYHVDAEEEQRQASLRAASRWGKNVTVTATTAGFGERLGILVHGWDFWWEFHDRIEMEGAASEVIEAPGTYALPAVEATLDTPVPNAQIRGSIWRWRAVMACSATRPDPH
jgi:hypothetical protein